jgi:hypothetical protein
MHGRLHHISNNTSVGAVQEFKQINDPDQSAPAIYNSKRLTGAMATAPIQSQSVTDAMLWREGQHVVIYEGADRPLGEPKSQPDPCCLGPWDLLQKTLHLGGVQRSQRCDSCRQSGSREDFAGDGRWHGEQGLGR